mmetsp:Transcript_4868/g.13662  ORF Transcript_4868/g.13662 Transcript_4868/m.13662 type:complete len:213 (-) Transcript_4868:218-856(-)
MGPRSLADTLHAWSAPYGWGKFGLITQPMPSTLHWPSSTLHFAVAAPAAILAVVLTAVGVEADVVSDVVAGPLVGAATAVALVPTAAVEVGTAITGLVVVLPGAAEAAAVVVVIKAATEVATGGTVPVDVLVKTVVWVVAAEVAAPVVAGAALPIDAVVDVVAAAWLPGAVAFPPRSVVDALETPMLPVRLPALAVPFTPGPPASCSDRPLG